MITYLQLGKKGNLGNQLFQVASTLSIAEKNNQNFVLPKWEYAHYFINNLPMLPVGKIQFDTVHEISYNYNELLLLDGNYSLNGWFQSERYFNIESVKKQFEFKPELINKIEEKYKKQINSKHILISVRRGDFVNHPYYYQLDYKYYMLAITTQFQDWNQRHLIFTSDDIEYCKTHFGFLKNAIFIENTKAIEQLVLGSLCKDFIISNSTFSWWMAWLGERQTSKIIRPKHNFRGDFLTKNNDKDYFPDRWILFDYKKFELDNNFLGLKLKGSFFKLIDYILYQKKNKIKYLKKTIKKIIKK